MLATLNLQLSPVELLDDNTLTPVSLAPAETGEAESGFADLLRLRVDAALTADTAGGELLPEGGSELPIFYVLPPDEAITDLSSTPETGVRPVQLAPPPSEIQIEAEGLLVPDESVDLVLETPVLYPPPVADTDTDPEALTLAPILTGAQLQPTSNQAPSKPEVAVEGRHAANIERPTGLNIGPATVVPAPVIDGREARAQNPAAGQGVAVAMNLGLRERGQQHEPASRAAPITVTNTNSDFDDRGALTDLARRFDLAPTQRTDSATDTLQARFAVAQATQTSQGPVSPQPSQSTLSLSAAAAADSGYASAAQQSTDLISTSVRDRAWGEQVGDRVVMMASNQVKQAEIRLTPAELGPLRVQVSVDDGNTHVTFHAQHAATREALEQALPRLRELLAENGLSLGQADVSDRGVNDDGGERGPDGGALNPAADDAADIDLEIAGESTQRATTSNGLVDTFA